MPSDEERLTRWARRVGEGDNLAFDALFAHVTPRMLPVISRFARDREDAQDMLQEVAIQLFRALPKFRGECLLTTFIYRITLNVCMNTRKRQTSRAIPFSDFAGEDDAAPFDDRLSGSAWEEPPARLINRERREALHAAIYSLAPQFRAVFVLAELEGLKYEEIAAIMRSPIGVVRSRLHRARQALRKKILAQRELFYETE